MNRSGEESQGSPNRSLEDVPFPPLNLPLTKTPELINLIQQCPCPHQQKLPNLTENSKAYLTPPETPKKTERPKAVNFHISKITIGEWTRIAVFDDDLKGKFYFAKKRLMWEDLDNVDTGTGILRLKKKIEIQWADVLSLRATFHSHDETEILEIELRKRPTFYMETTPQAGKHTQWKQMDQDFTLNQSASTCRRHTLHFAPGVLQKNLEKLVSSDSFWSELIKVKFPSLQNPYFDVDHENNNSSHYSHGQTPTFNIYDDLRHLHSQGFGHVGVGEVNFNMGTQFFPNDGRQMSSFTQDNGQNNNLNQLLGMQVIQPSLNQLLGTQVIQPSSQLINEHHNNRARYFGGSRFNNPMNQDESQMRNTGEFRGSQPLLERQTNSMIVPHMNEPSIYPPQIGPYLRSVLAQEGAIQNMKHRRIDGNFQNNGIYSGQFGHYDYDQYSRNNNGSLPPDL